MFKRQTGERNAPATGQWKGADDRQYPVAPEFGSRKNLETQPPDGVKTVGSDGFCKNVLKFYL